MGWDRATGWMRRILADVWDLDLDIVETCMTRVRDEAHRSTCALSAQTVAITDPIFRAVSSRSTSGSSANGNKTMMSDPPNWK
ncbi:hypothetical protein GCM10009773_36540 [Williamsia serinedens]